MTSRIPNPNVSIRPSSSSLLNKQPRTGVTYLTLSSLLTKYKYERLIYWDDGPQDRNDWREAADRSQTKTEERLDICVFFRYE